MIVIDSVYLLIYSINYNTYDVMCVLQVNFFGRVIHSLDIRLNLYTSSVIVMHLLNYVLSHWKGYRCIG